MRSNGCTHNCPGPDDCYRAHEYGCGPATMTNLYQHPALDCQHAELRPSREAGTESAGSLSAGGLEDLGTGTRLLLIVLLAAMDVLLAVNAVIEWGAM